MDESISAGVFITTRKPSPLYPSFLQHISLCVSLCSFNAMKLGLNSAPDLSQSPAFSVGELSFTLRASPIQKNTKSHCLVVSSPSYATET